MSDEQGATDRGQVVRLRRLAIQALARYDIAHPRMQLIAHEENTTFRVRSPAAEYLLRVHRPEKHGRAVDSAAAVISELQWLAGIRADTPLAVPEPVRTLRGELTTTERVEGVDGSRVCSLLRWMKGRNHHHSARPVHLYRLGRVLAQLHDHADHWPLPDGFVRTRWDHETFFGNTMVFGSVEAADAWKLLPENIHRDFAAVAARVGDVMEQLGQGADVFGLIHADAHLDNVLFDGPETCLIDFDDCGFGYRMYDVAVALWELRHRDDYLAFKAAFVRGYTEHRPLPAEQLQHLDAFMAAREVAFGLWLVGMAESRPSLREQLPTELGYIDRSMRLLLDS